jgi:hypothetical protein
MASRPPSARRGIEHLKVSRFGQGTSGNSKEWIEKCARPRLIIIDTLAMVRMPNRKDQTNYDADYAAVKELRDLAGKSGVAIAFSLTLRPKRALFTRGTVWEVAMISFCKFVFCVLIVAVVFPAKGQAQCDIRSFMVQNITSFQESDETILAFLLTASEKEYDNAKTGLSHAGSWLGPYGLFDDKTTYSQAKEKAHEIAQAINFNYQHTYAASYFNQQASGEALNAYVQCLNKNKNSPGLPIWLAQRNGDFFTYQAFWVGADTTQPLGKIEGTPNISGVDIISFPDTWVKGAEQPIVLKRKGNVDFYLGFKVSGQSNAIYAVPDPPPEPTWQKATVISNKQLTAASHGTGEACGGSSDSDCIYPAHPAGFFVPGTRTVSPNTTDPHNYGEKYTADRPDQICVTISQSTGDCQQTQVAKGRLQAIERYPEAAH